MSDEKPKGVDISKLGLEMSDEDRKATDKKLRRKFKDLSSGVGKLGSAHKAALGLGASGVFADMARQSEPLRQIVDPVGLRSLTMDIDRASFGLSQSIVIGGAILGHGSGVVVVSRAAQKSSTFALSVLGGREDIHRGIVFEGASCSFSGWVERAADCPELWDKPRQRSEDVGLF